MKTIAIVCLVVAPWASARGAASGGREESSIHALARALSEECWNKHDGKACASFWTRDGSLLTPDGTRIDGREEIERLLDRDLKGLFKGSIAQVTVQAIHWHTPELAFVDMEQTVTGFTRADGSPVRDQKFQWSASVVLEGGKWLIDDARTYIFVTPAARSSEAIAPGPLTLTERRLALPGADGQPVSMDYLATDRVSGRIWVSAGNAGSVAVVDTANGSLNAVSGFPTSATLGPSTVAVGNGVVYVGNRGDSKICVVEPTSLQRGRCIALWPRNGGVAFAASGLAFIRQTEELWVSLGAPRPEIVVIDAKSPRSLRLKTRIQLAGIPGHFAVDHRRGLFFTNLQEQGRTIAIWARGHRMVASWRTGCDREGPRGVAVDEERNLLFVACTDRIVTLDAGHGGVQLSISEAGAGIDHIDYLPSKKRLYVAAGKAATLTVFHVDNRGVLSPVASAPTATGAQVVVADAAGTAYVADSSGGQILEFRSD